MTISNHKTRWLIAFIACALTSATVGMAWAFDDDSATENATTELSSLDGQLTERWKTTVEPLMQKHCGDCHFQGNNEGGVRLDEYQDLNKIREHASTWEQIRGVIRAEAMPPPESSELNHADRQTLTAWIESALHDVDCNCEAPPSHVTLRRLNQLEYDNTIHDLFQIDFKPSKVVGFVSDDVGNGFDNQGEVLSLPPITLEKYLQAASLIAEQVIQTDREKFRKQRFEGESLFLDQRMTAPIYVAAGAYNLSVRMRFGDDQKDTCKAKILLDDQVVSELDVAPRDETYKVDLNIAAGEHQLVVWFVEDKDEQNRGALNRRLIIESLRLVGPAEGLPAYPKSHENIVIARPEQKDTPESQPIGNAESARRVITHLLPRVYRRPVSEQEIEAIVLVCRKASDAGFDYENSLRYGIQAMLVSPSFLFRNEAFVQDDRGIRVDDYAIASRLSYFLWSTMPDETLLELARQGKLHEPNILAEQVERMLQSPKIDSFLNGFFSQWLGLRNLNKLEIDRDKYPIWSDRLRAAMIHETELFCQSLLREGSIDDITQANYTFVNPRLADFYGVLYNGRDPAEMYRRRPGRRGGTDPRRMGLFENEDDWVRVELPANRKGLLTQAAVLALTSNPTRTSPVKRGKWILENMLGDPPPSAPPSVPSLDQANHDANVSLRERLEIHRSNPSCAGCHKLMDPLGLGLENFDAIGKWRDSEGEHPINPQGVLADGRTFQGPLELVSLLADRKPQVVRNMASRMLTYAIGRGLQRQDRCDIDRIVEYAANHNDSFRSVVVAIVLSDAFLQRTDLNPIASSP